MYRFLVAAGAAVAMVSAANAADLGARPVYKSATPAAVVAYNWSGLYAGGHIGWGWQNSEATLLAETVPGPFPIGTVIAADSSGFLGGGQIGYNWQGGGPWVLGVEADFSWTGADQSAVRTSLIPVPGTTVTAGADFNWFATLTARAGYAWDNWLAYLKGGVAWADVEFSGSNVVPLIGTFVASPNSDTRVGWTVGVGVEHAFARRWSWKLEYAYMDFGSETYSNTTIPATGVSTVAHELDVHAVKFGLNYRFGGV